jgi:hypothetical protein
LVSVLRGQTMMSLKTALGYDSHDLPLGAFHCNAVLLIIHLHTQTLTVTI